MQATRYRRYFERLERKATSRVRRQRSPATGEFGPYDPSRSQPTLDNLNRTQLARLCAERLGIREIERQVFEALHARRERDGPT
jgi:hypothetical protein